MRLREGLSGGATVATMRLDVELKRAAEGGRGHNVVASLPGSSPDLPQILVSAHHDSNFKAGLDDTGGVIAAMLIAKAQQLSGAAPHRPSRSC